MNDLYAVISGLGNQRMEDVGIWAFIFIILTSLISALAFSALYSFFFSKRATGSQVHRAFPLLAISITVIFITIQFSLPLSLGLLGALSIVRFRTPIKEPEEIGFIMLVVASSLACATFNIMFVVILAIVSVIALYSTDLLSPLSKSKFNGGMLVIRGPKKENSPTLIKNIQKEVTDIFKNGSLHSISCDDEICITFVFHKIPQDKINTISAKMLESYPDFQFNIMVNRTSAL